MTKSAKTDRPLLNLFLLDLLRDRDSWPILAWTGGALLVGALAYHRLEGWSLLDALYFCVITLATIGYGDLTPTTPLAKIFTIVYVINGIAILLTLFDRMRLVRSRRIQARIDSRANKPALDAPGSDQGVTSQSD